MNYPYNVFRTKVEEHVFWVAECPTLKGCVGQGETPDEAVAELESNVNEWLKTAAEYEIEIPEVPIEMMSDYSGKFTVRVAPYVHKQAAEFAKKHGVSLNQYVNDAIVTQNKMLSTALYIEPEIKTLVENLKAMNSNSNGRIYMYKS